MSARLLPVAAQASELAKASRRLSSQVVRTSAQGPTLWFPRRGFERESFGLKWFPNREALFESIPAVGPKPVFVAAPYEYEASDSAGLMQARKYAAFASYADYWDLINEFEREEKPQSLHEVFTSEQARCLYFDLDGHPGYKSAHRDLMLWLQLFVRWFFNGDLLGWAPSDPEPVVLASAEPSKYSCHVVFPQVQFRSHEHQSEYMPALLSALPALEVDLGGQESVPVLDRLVDRVPYTSFQLLRGPYACKLKTGELRYDTRLEPDMFFRNDELTCFAGNVDSDYSLVLPKLSELLEQNTALKDLCSRQVERVNINSSRPPSPQSAQDLAALYQDCFRKRHMGGVLYLASMTAVEQFEACLAHLHPDRASDWYSWFRISGVTCRLLDNHVSDLYLQARIWKAHFAWSQGYHSFDEDENINLVEQARGRFVPGINLLVELVQHDNPGLEVYDRRFKCW